MLPRSVVLGLFLVAGCAATQRNAPRNFMFEEKVPGLFVGHSDNGDIVVAAHHYDAMAGRAITDTDVGFPARGGGSDGLLLCNREMPTGSHLPRWICRYQEDIERVRLATQAKLSELQIMSVRRSSLAGIGSNGNLPSN